MNRLLIILSLFFSSGIINAQADQKQNICLKLFYGDQAIRLDEGVFISGDIRIETLKFYIGQIKFYKADELGWSDPQPYHLVDASEVSSMCIAGPIDHADGLDEIHFLIGVDSMTSASGVFGGDLDPTNGMYWAWHSGYINFKLEGEKIKEDKTKQIFNFHLGGFLAPYNNVMRVRLPINKARPVTIHLDIKSILTQIDFSKTHTVMSPSAKAVEISKLISSSLHIDE